MRNVHIIGVPLDLGGGRRGVDMGPSAVRIAGLGERLAALGFRVRDEGNVITPTQETVHAGDPHQRYVREIADVCTSLYEKSLAALESNGLPLVLGGDHSLAAGSVSATATYARRQGKPVGLLWIDAHGDMNTPATTLSGNVHGMPLAALLGPEPAALSAIGGFSPKVSPANTVLLGVRNLDDREKTLVPRLGRPCLYDEGHRPPGHRHHRRAGDRLRERRQPQAFTYRSTSMCAIRLIAPGVGTPVKGGLDYREAHMVMEIIADSSLLLALDIVEVNPVLDIQNATAILGANWRSPPSARRLFS